MNYRPVFRLFLANFLFAGSIFPLQAQAQIIPGQDYVIVSFRTGRVIDVFEISKENGAPIIFWDRHNGGNQVFRLEPAGDDYYRIRNTLSDKLIEIRNSEQGDDAMAQQWEYSGAANQQFKLIPASGGYYFIIARHSNKALQEKSTGERGGLLSQTTDTRVITQMFQFVPFNNTLPPVQALSAPVLTIPSDKAAFENQNNAGLNFDWEDVPGATGYQFRLYHETYNTELVNTEVDGSYFNFLLVNQIRQELDGSYFNWAVRAKQGNTWGPWSIPFRLYQPVRAVTPPQLRYPPPNTVLENGSTDLSKGFQWLFKWNPVSQASQYQLYVGFTDGSAYINRLQSENTYTHREPNNTYFSTAQLNGWIWKVRAEVNGVWTDWSEARPFTISAPGIPAPPAPTYKYEKMTCWVECGYLHAYLAIVQDVYGGKDLTFGPRKIGVEQKQGQRRAIFQLESASPVEDRYLIKVLTQNSSGQSTFEGYLDYKLEISDQPDNYWKVVSAHSNFVRIYMPDSNQALEVIDGTNYNPTITVQLRPLSQDQRQLFNFIRR